MHDDPTLFGHRTVTPDAVARFAELTGDYARIHVDQALGRVTPQGRGFAHGLLSASWALGALSRARPGRVGRTDPNRCVTAFEVRFGDVVSFGDTLGFRCDESEAIGEVKRSPFACITDDGRVVTTGAVEVGSPGDAAPATPWPAEPYAGLDMAPGEEWRAEDFADRGPSGVLPVRTFTEADVVAWTGFTADLDPLWLHAPFAEASPFGARTVPPMLAFCLGFSTWLDTLLSLPLAGDQSSAGHLGDRWRFVAPIHLGDSVEVRFRPERLRRTRSEPVRGILTYGLQLVNQRGDVVQEGEVDMMMAVRDAA